MKDTNQNITKRVQRRAQKRAQLTVFIIIGILLLAGAAILAVYYTTSIKVHEAVTEKEQEVPSWAQPIKDYVDNCITEKSVEAFKKIGQHGGYINPEDRELSGVTFNLNKKDPTNSDAAYLSETSPVVYWWYMGSDNLCSECRVSSLLPSMNDIQRQVNMYVTRELKKCIDNFKSFKEAGFEITEGAIATATSVNKDDVTVKLSYPLTIRHDASEFKITAFKTDLDIDFQHIYDLAVLTTVDEINNLTVEDITLNLLSVYAGTPDAAKIPPISWIDSKKSFVTWSKDKVEQRLKDDVLTPNINLIQVDRTKDAKPIAAATDVTRGFYETLYLKYLPFDYPTFTVNFFYDPGWKIFFDITPRSGSTLEPRVLRQNFPANFAPSEQTNYYEFYYDISFPTVVIVRDEKSLRKEGEKGYTFMFALESNIRDNKDLHEWNQGRGTIGYYDPNSVTTTFKLQDTSFGSCTGSGTTWQCPLNGRTYADNITCNFGCTSSATTITKPKFVESLMCNSNQRIGTEVTVQAYDDNKTALNDVSLSYTCGNYRTCLIGSTDASGIFVGKLPLCIGQGALKLEKDGVLSETIRMQSAFNKTKDINAALIRIVDKPIKIQTSDYNALLDGQFKQSARPLLGNEEVTLSVSRVKQSDDDDSITSSIVMNQGSSQQTIRLVPGMYQVQAILQNVDGTVISTDTSGLPSGGIPSITIKPVITGGMELSNAAGYWVVSKDDIENHKLVTFYLYKVFNPVKIEDIVRGGDITNISRTYRAQFEPVFS